MGLLDMPLVSEMDEIEKKAARGDQEALRMIYETMSPMRKRHLDLLMAKHKGMTLKQAMDKAGILICVR